MRVIYYKVFIEWCKYPFNDEIENKYCLFSFSKKKFKPIQNLELDSHTSIQDKTEYLKSTLKISKFKIEKIK